MKRGFYFRLAIDGMRKNKRLYVPYLLTCAGMIAMFYILCGLSNSPVVSDMRGGSTITDVLMLGCIVIALFSVLFLFYTNSFLVRRRNKEFGLYNILGMNKRNISRILICETFLTALISLTVGLVSGILLSKLAELILLKMAIGEVGYSLWINMFSLGITIAMFGVIFVLLLISSLAKVSLSKPLDLLRSEVTGEKPPKANFLFALAGIVILGFAYYLALMTRNSVEAILLFFAAVLMVIVATYLLFIAGSVALCKVLQKNKKYYYKPAHFVSVSSMVFRMKRNGAGLASICILATMVLVMLSSTSCLYFGGENAVKAATPYDMMMRVWYDDLSQCTEASLDDLVSLTKSVTDGHERNVTAFSAYDTDGYVENGLIDVNGVDHSSLDIKILSRIRSIQIIPLSDYNRLTGNDIRLEENEALIWSSDKEYPYDTFGILGCESVKNVKKIKDLPIRISSNDTLTALYVLIVPDWEEYTSEIETYIGKLNENFERNMIFGDYRQFCYFDLSGLDNEAQIELVNTLEKTTHAPTRSRAAERKEFYSMYGSLFFLGIVLSAIFIAAAALIIYYKQLSEGYEDKGRFNIMQKVGMTHEEIKSTINSQVLTVFFAPLVLAGIHLVFAFPFVQKMLRLFCVDNLPLLIGTNVVCFLFFSLFYIFVYRQTAHSYYKIVSDLDAND